jgi:hypothetical protein
MKKKTLVILSFVVFSCITLFSCAPTMIPAAFDDVVGAGSAGNPKAEIILNADFPVVPDSMLVYSINKSVYNDSSAEDIARQLGFAGDSAPLRADEKRIVYSYSVGPNILEIYPDGRVNLFGSSNLNSTTVNALTDEECKSIARTWLISHNFLPENIIMETVTVNTTVATADANTGSVGTATPLTKIVHFFTSINNTELHLPSAAVIIGADGKVASASINLWYLEKLGEYSLISPQAAFEIIKDYVTSPDYYPPEMKACLVNIRGFQKLEINGVSIKYSSDGDFMRPLYIFYGVAFAESFPSGEEFIGKVDALAR